MQFVKMKEKRKPQIRLLLFEFAVFVLVNPFVVSGTY